MASIIRVDPPPVVPLRLHTTPPYLLRQDGMPIWEEVTHPRGDPTLEYRGHKSHTVTLSLIFDTEISGRTDVEDELATLHAFTQRTSDGEPPRLRLDWGHGQQLRWVITDIRYHPVEGDGRDVDAAAATVGRPTTRPEGGRRILAVCEVDLHEHRSGSYSFDPITEAEETAAATPTDSSGTPAGPVTRPTDGQQRTYIVQPGDTLTFIAARHLGDAGRWRQIYDLNNPNPMNRGPDFLLPGWVLRLP